MKIGNHFSKAMNYHVLLAAVATMMHGNSWGTPEVESIENSIVRVVFGGHGTGWVVSPGVVATNWHVTEDNISFDIYPAGSDDRYRGELIWQGNSDRDIGLISVPDLNLPPLKLHTNDAVRGSASYTVGFPGLGDDLTGRANLNVSVYTGAIALVTENVAGVKIIQHTNIVNAGNSGGPLLDDCGRVLGLTTWGVENEQYSADFIWASVHVSELASQMDILGIPYQTDNSSCVGEATLDELGSLQNQLGSQAGQMDILQGQIRTWGIGLGAVLALTLVLALRRPRQQLVRVYDSVTRRISGTDSSIGTNSFKGPQERASNTAARDKLGLVLSTNSGDKNPVRIEFNPENLQRAGKGLSVGRSEELSDFVIVDGQVSRRHLRILFKEKQIMVEDLNSSNGTYVNGQLLMAFKPRVLHVGDKIKIGETEISVSFA